MGGGQALVREGRQGYSLVSQLSVSFFRFRDDLSYGPANYVKVIHQAEEAAATPAALVAPFRPPISPPAPARGVGISAIALRE